MGSGAPALRLASTHAVQGGRDGDVTCGTRPRGSCRQGGEREAVAVVTASLSAQHLMHYPESLDTQSTATADPAGEVGSRESIVFRRELGS